MKILVITYYTIIVCTRFFDKFSLISIENRWFRTIKAMQFRFCEVSYAFYFFFVPGLHYLRHLKGKGKNASSMREETSFWVIKLTF